MPEDTEQTGGIAWATRHSVAPNLLMGVLLIGGLIMAMRIKQEVFPEFDEDMVTITVPYPGSSPEEVEQGIVLAIEEAVRGIDGVKEISAVATEGGATVTAELLTDADDQKVYQEIDQEVDRITTFPEEAEEAQVVLRTHRREVLSVLLYGDVDEWSLRELAEQVRDRLLQDPGITQIDLFPDLGYEVSIEVPQAKLRAYGLTLDAVAERIRLASIELPGGRVKTQAGEILLRVKERRDYAREFAQIPIVTSPQGTELRLEDIAVVKDTFEETDQVRVYNQKRCVELQVFRVGEQTPIGVSDAVRKCLETLRTELPPGVSADINHDMSDVYRQRLELLLRNGCLGLMLVFGLLGFFLEFKLAFWVALGIPISFLGAFLFLPGMDISINMVSMFAFIVALGIVVDDAIVAGENIYEHRQQGMGLLKAAILGARDVAVPITFAILTNIVAFLPLAFIPGIMGKIFRVIPLVVATVFVISWVESLLILPTHLAHTSSESRTRLGRWVHVRQQRFSRLVSRFIENGYGPFLDRCLRLRYLTVATGLGVLIVIVGYVVSGRMGFVLMPKVESDRAVATAVLPYGSPLSKTTAVRDRLLEVAGEIVETHGGETLAEGILGAIDENQVTVMVFLTDPEVRPLGTAELTRMWRAETGPIKGLESLKFESDRGGPGSGASLTVELAHRDTDVLDRASQSLAASLGRFGNVKDIDDGFTPGKQQLDFKILPEGRSLALTASGVARQVRSAFYGAEALRQQRGRNEVKVMVRLPEAERVSEYDVEELMIRTAFGRDVPLRQVAEVERGRAYTNITRREARRTVTVSADVVPRGQTEQVVASLKESVLPALVREYPGLSYSFEGHQADMRESLGSLKTGFLMALLMIYALLAIPFRSYAQPIIVMVSIPFGIVGAVIGHLIMGYNLSVISMMGVVALSGVVVNDALILIMYANEQRAAGANAHQAVQMAGVRRFRPILLTTLTTFGGLAPMIFETSRQARFLIPMALSLGYGIVFATVITLLLVPCLYLIVEDAKRRVGRTEGLLAAPHSPDSRASIAPQ